MKPVVAAKILQEAQSNFNFYIYFLFLDHFCVLIVMIRCSLCKIHGSEKLLKAIRLNSRRHDLTAIELNVDKSRRLFIRYVV